MIDSVQNIRQKIMPILLKFHVKKAGVFGSVVRGEDKSGSDVDILVEIDQETAADKYFELKSELEIKLGRNVDLVEYDLLHPVIKNRVLEQQVNIL